MCMSLYTFEIAKSMKTSVYTVKSHTAVTPPPHPPPTITSITTHTGLNLSHEEVGGAENWYRREGDTAAHNTHPLCAGQAVIFTLKLWLEMIKHNSHMYTNILPFSSIQLDSFSLKDEIT